MTQLKFRKINIESYRPGKSTLGKIKNLIKLSANESALGVSSRVKKLNLKNINIEKYPDSKCKALRNQIAKKFKCDFNKIICGSGSDEIIQMICQLFLNKNDEVILPKYSFLMYFCCMIVITGAAGFIGSCLVSKFNSINVFDLILVDNFSYDLKKANLFGKKFLSII